MNKRRIGRRGIGVNNIENNIISSNSTMNINKRLIQVEGKDLVIGKTYYLDRLGEDKGVYEGILEEGDIKRCLFTPIGDTPYFNYSVKDYNGKYVGKFSLGLWAYFFEEKV